MPLPDTDQAWPPKVLDVIAPKLREWSAWWSGDVDELAAVYSGAGGRRLNRPSQYSGGVVGKVARWFWGQPNPPAQQRTRLHVPIAADLAQASADLLFAEPPTITAGGTQAQARVETLIEDSVYAALAEAAEVGAALAGVYVRVTWDRDVNPEGPFLTSVHTDAAVPEFRYGRLWAVTFWWVVRRTDTEVVRHLERHELDNRGIGVIYHGLYLGTTERLGRPIPLTEDPATAHLADQVDQDGKVSTETPGLAVEFVPNVRPARKWRTHPIGSALGRSDLEGVEGEMDALDETWSSWMRDIRIGKARVFVAKSMLDAGGPGEGASWDADREVYAPLETLASREGGLAANLHAEQFKIRVEEHARTCNELVRIIMRTAGYSAQTFGEAAEQGGREVTAKEITARERRSFLTRDRKIRLWRPRLVRIVEKLLAVDRALFAGNAEPDPEVSIDFGDSVQDDPKALAETAKLLRDAEAASTRTLVGMSHPDWDESKVDEEVDAILTEKRERESLLADPLLTGGGPRTAPLPDEDDPDDE